MVERGEDVAKMAVELGVAMVRIRSRLRRESLVVANERSWSQVATLLRITTEGPITVSELAQAEHVRPQSMAETVAVLRAEGLVSARSDPNDGRKTLITATAEGAALVAQVSEKRDESLSRIIESVIAPEEYGDLAKAVELLNRLVDADVVTGTGR
jgi:DNA-binding MarR family transcriptional regulator